MAKKIESVPKKIWLISILFFLITLNTSTIFAISIDKIKLTSYINDYANVIDENLEQEIYNHIQNLEKNTSVEIAILTIDSTEDVPIREYAIQVAHGVVGKKEKDNGILLLLAVQDRQWDIEIGYGLEAILNDAKVGRIGRDLMVPYFKQGKYGEGLLEAVKEIEKIITNTTEYNYEVEKESSRWMIVIFIFLMFMPIIIFLVILFIAIQKVKKKYPRKKMSDAAFWAAVFTATQLNKKKGKGGAGIFTSTGSGGFGGFGGGSFGGGGASGSF